MFLHALRDQSIHSGDSYHRSKALQILYCTVFVRPRAALDTLCDSAAGGCLSTLHLQHLSLVRGEGEVSGTLTLDTIMPRYAGGDT